MPERDGPSGPERHRLLRPERDGQSGPERDGLFGPESVTWRIHADPMLIVGGIRALYLQALHPRAMAGVAAQSGFQTDAWGRLRRTGEYVGTITFGTVREAERAGARVRGIHRRLAATDPFTGEPFRIDDPELLRWIHACEVDSFLQVVRRAGVAVSAAEADRYVAEQVRSARLVGLPDAPASVAELDAYFGSMRGQLHLTPAGREAARFILCPPMPTWVTLGTPARPAWGSLALLGFATLPGWARRRYGALGLGLADCPVDAALRAVRLALLAIPPRLREGPALRSARERLAA